MRRAKKASGWHSPKLYAILAIICLICVEPALAKNSDPSLPTLYTAHAAHSLTIKEAARNYPVRLIAVVTYYDRSIDPRRPTLFVSDSSGGIFVELSKFPAFTIKAGDVIAISGVTGPGDYAPIVERAEARPVGVGHLPANATRVNMMTLLTGAEDGQWVEVEGVVHAVRYSSSGANVFFDIALRDGVLVAQTVTEPNVDYSQFVDDTIVLRGNASPIFNHWRQMTGSQLVFPDVGSIKVEENAPSEPFASPAENVGNLFRYKPSGGLSHRVHIQGRVTLQWPGRLLCIHDDGQGLCAETNDSNVVHVGDRVELIGFPSIGEFGPSITHAYYRRIGNEAPLAPSPVTPQEIFRQVPQAELVALQGRLIGLNEAEEDPTIILAVGNLTFNASLPNKSSIGFLRSLSPGSLLKLTGICILRSDGTGHTTGSGFPIVSGFQIMLRTPDDVQVLHKPSWWTASHTLYVLIVVVLLMFGILTRMVVLSKQVTKQTLTIVESEKKYRFLATHDSLTQLPNRHAILTTISSAVKSAQMRDTSASVALVDLDHFKAINDTYGHLAGDEVLRQAASRLSSSIRNSDSIGRYGGEEFLIVFQGASEQIGFERCEFIRKAVCSEPIYFGSIRLSVSCSIGVASTDSRSIESAAMLIGLADDALYIAKANGRNCVERAQTKPVRLNYPSSAPPLS